MNSTIYYFSGTGNSLKMAKEVAKNMENCKLIPIAKFSEDNSIVCETDCVGFVFPEYYWGLPKIIYDFIKNLNLDKSTYVFAIITRGAPFRGAIPHQLKNLLKQKTKSLNAIFFITMVANNVTMYNITSPEKQKRKNVKAKNKIEKISEIIKKKRKKNSRVLFYFIGILMNNIFRKRVNKGDSKYYVNDNCNSCEICEKVCPVNNIKITDGKPVWQHYCQKCVACIHLCPQKAIQYGKKTVKRRRYLHDEITINEIMNQK